MSDTEFDDEDETVGTPTTLLVRTPEDEHPERADRQLADLLPDLSRSRLKALIKQGCVSIEGEDGDWTILQAPTAKLTAGLSVKVLVPPPPYMAPETNTCNATTK